MINPILDQLEGLLLRMAKPEALDDESLRKLPAQWESAVERLVLATGIHQGSETEKATIRKRVNAIMEQLPAIQAGLSKYQSEVARQLYSETRRVKTMRGNQASSRRESLLRKTA